MWYLVKYITQYQLGDTLNIKRFDVYIILVSYVHRIEGKIKQKYIANSCAIHMLRTILLRVLGLLLYIYIKIRRPNSRHIDDNILCDMLTA